MFTIFLDFSQPGCCNILEIICHLPCQCLVSRYIHLLLFTLNVAGITKCYKYTQYSIKTHKQMTGLAYKKYYEFFIFSHAVSKIQRVLEEHLITESGPKFLCSH